MTKEEIFEKYSEKLSLKTYSWMLLPAISVKKDGRVAISGIEEIDKDILFFNYQGATYIIKNIQLTKQFTNYNYLQGVLKDCIKNKSNIVIRNSFPEPDVEFEYLAKGAKGQVLFTPLISDVIYKVEDINLNTESLIEDNFMKKVMSKVKELKKVSPIVFRDKCTNGAEIDNTLASVKESLTEEKFLHLFSQLYILGEEKKWI